MRTGLGLAQAGEFGFVLLNLILDRHLVDATLLQAILASMLLSMLAAPFLIQYATDRDAAAVDRMDAAVAADDPDRGAKPQAARPRDHLRLRPQRAEPGAHARAEGIPTSRSTSIPIA
jgi:Kef-type K+ transport system membrane component KefB